MILTQKGGRTLVKEEAEGKKEPMKARDIIKDPYVLDFLELKANTNFYEQELEQAIIDKYRIFYWNWEKDFHL